MPTAAASTQAGPTAIDAMLQEAYERGEASGRIEGWTECAAQYGLPLAAVPRFLRRRHLASVPAVPDAAALILAA